MTTLNQPPETADELFRLYPLLAARVSNLRTILQNPDSISKEDALAWAEDVKSVMEDCMKLCTATAVFLRKLPQLQESPND